MSEKYRISVIMGIYNCASTLAEALDSLLAQTYQSFKVIMCDDGSKDNTMEVAQQYVDRYPGKFILIKNERNLKLAATLNHCLEYADTEYVARMDGDDISLPTRFEKQINFLDKHMEYALVSCPMIHFDEHGDYFVGTAQEMPTKESFRKSTPFCHAPCMVRSEVYREVNGYTVERKTERMEDYYLWYKIYRAGHIGYNLQEALYKMRDDRNAKNRRASVSNRIQGCKTDIEICKGLGLSYPYFYPILHLLKIFTPLIPYSVYMKLRGKK
jgi:glycosyltransferase EpsE